MAAGSGAAGGLISPLPSPVGNPAALPTSGAGGGGSGRTGGARKVAHGRAFPGYVNAIIAPAPHPGKHTSPLSWRFVVSRGQEPDPLKGGTPAGVYTVAHRSAAAPSARRGPPAV